MSILGKQVRLKGLTQKGKNRCRENGDLWTVYAETDRVLFNPAPGPWLYIAPYSGDQTHKASRWVHATSDVDFTITNHV
jgi:hypothetical protein